ncbi:hypothetical protein [Clostridium sp.]
MSVVCHFVEISDKEGYRQLSIFTDEETCDNSLTRKVTNKLMENIYTIKKKIDDGESDSLVAESEEKQISANFYEALNGLNFNSDSVIVEFTAD